MLAAAPLHDGPPPAAKISVAAALGAVLSRSERKLDYADAKLAIDRLVDPTLDIEGAAAELDRLTSAASELVRHAAGPNARLAGLRRLIYEPGPWNDQRPFAYDQNDPLGQSPRSRLLPVYLARLDSINGGRFSRYLGKYLEAIMTGQVSTSRQTLEGPRAGLPGGWHTFYQRYEIPSSAAFPDVFSGARVAWRPGSPLIYLGPDHGEPHPLVPQGWIRLRYGPRGE